MHYCLCQLQANQKELKKEILHEIKAVKGITEKQLDTKGITEKMKNLNAKKRKAIDLMLDGLISKADLQEQANWYDGQLAELSEILSNSQGRDKAQAKQADVFEQCITALDEIMAFGETNQSLYREILDKAVIYHGNTVDVWLKCVPFGMKLSLHSYGKNEGYITDILAMEVIEKS